VRFIQSIDEADLVIKNIGENETNKGNDVLVSSADTDYFVLFANNEKVWVTLNYPNSPIYHPVTQWIYNLTDHKNNETLVNKNKIYDYVIRFAALFGNDYHISTIISAKDPTYTICNRIIAPMAMNDVYGEVNKLRNIYKFYTSGMELYKKCIEPISPDELDIIVQDFILKNDKYDFRKYLMSIVIYKNWNRFNKYDTVQPNMNTKDIEKMVLGNLLCSNKIPENTNKYEYMITHRCYDKFYDWNITDDGEIIDIKELPTDIDALYSVYNRSEDEEIEPNIIIDVEEL
jgi:hypothetical protein